MMIYLNNTQQISNNLKGILMLIGLVLFINACSSDRQSVKSAEVIKPECGLYEHIWQVEDIDHAGIIDRSHITMNFSKNGQVVGSTGCNRYFAAFDIDGDSLRINQAGSTQIACTSAIMQQEYKFLQALNKVHKYQMVGEFLNLYDENNTRSLRLIRSSEQTNLQSNSSHPQDTVKPEEQQVHQFSCDNELVFEFTFVGPETLKASMGNHQYTLQRDVSASGAKYVGKGIEFWNKGKMALLEIAGQHYDCQKKTKS